MLTSNVVVQLLSYRKTLGAFVYLTTDRDSQGNPLKEVGLGLPTDHCLHKNDKIRIDQQELLFGRLHIFHCIFDTAIQTS